MSNGMLMVIIIILAWEVMGWYLGLQCKTFAQNIGNELLKIQAQLVKFH
jgi:hypothetical protein